MFSIQAWNLELFINTEVSWEQCQYRMRATPKVMSHFIMLAHNIRGGYWWYSSRNWTFLTIFHYILLPCNRWQQRDTGKKASDVEVHVKQKCQWIPLCGKHCTHWYSLMTSECLRRPNSGCEHREAEGSAFLQWQQGTVYGAGYWLQCIGNDGGNVGISQFAPGGSHKCSLRNRNNTETVWAWRGRFPATAPLPVMRHGVTTVSQSHSGISREVEWCSLSSGIGKEWSFWISWNPEKPSALTCTLPCWISWKPELPQPGQKRRQPFSCKMITPGLTAVWRPWSTWPFWAVLSYHNHLLISASI